MKEEGITNKNESSEFRELLSQKKMFLSLRSTKKKQALRLFLWKTWLKIIETLIE
jgi:hypothetical protein